MSSSYIGKKHQSEKFLPLIETDITQTEGFNKYLINISSEPTKAKNDSLNKEYLSNVICTSKYTFLTAVPKILYEQFTQIGNLYFLVLAILQMLPSISQSGGNPILLIPLVIVVGINGIKDFIEDYKRKVSDERENGSKTMLLESSGIKEIEWKNVTPGQIIKIKKNEYFPADILMIYSSNKNGVAYVETKNLDGETNLKYKESVKYFYNKILNEKEGKGEENAAMKIESNLILNIPDAKMYEFSGIANIPQNDNPITLEYNNFLLRGSSLKNTDFILGMVIYVGHHSKIMLNSPNARGKFSKVSKLMNKTLLIIVLIQFIISLFFSLCQIIIEKNYKVLYNVYGGTNLFVGFLRWVLAISNLVPISLIVTMEMIRYCQAFFITNDANLYDKVNRRQAVVQSSGLNEELGQVHYIFTDKTGTLTKNIMRFKYVVIGNYTYGSEEHANQNDIRAKGVTNVDFNDINIIKHWEDKSHENSMNIEQFIFSLALCHTVIAEPDQSNLGKSTYNASSPDELALVNGAKYLGIEFVERTNDNDIILRYKDEKYIYKLLHILEFNSDRKRMGVIVRNMKTNKIQIIEKGADATLLPLMNSRYDKNNKQINYTLEQLEGFGRKGLRTLIFASRVLPEEEWEQYFREYNMFLKGSYENQREKDLALFQLYETIEREFYLLGATSIEDCLQDDLKETLSAFRDLGIKVFMLTGDHPFTAISIAHSSGLMRGDDIAEIVDSTSKTDILNKLAAWIEKKPIGNIGSYPIEKKKTLIITGNSLIQIYKESEKGQLRFALKNAIINSPCVICSRVSPKQKADIINLVKGLDPSKTTLAIGDGANDVNMINVADIGIGIYGNEGQQAARASDYALGQFSYLKRLLFIYGRESYRKNSFAICYVLWKNFLLACPTILFGFYSNFSGQLFYDPLLDSFYNVLYTAYPIGWYATIDRETSYDKLMKNPKRYRRGMKDKYFNAYQIIKWYGYAMITGYFIFLSHRYSMDISVAYNKKKVYDMYSFGASIETSIVFIVNFKLIFYSSIHTFYTFILMAATLLSFLLSVIIGSFCFPSMKIYSVFPLLFGNLNFYCIMVLLILSYFALEYGWNSTWFIIQKERKKYKKRMEEKRKKKELENPKEFSVKIDNAYTGYAFSHDAFDRAFQGAHVFKPSSSFHEIHLKKLPIKNENLIINEE